MKRNLRFALAAFCCAFVLASCENPFFIDETKLYLIAFEVNGGTPVAPLRTNKISVAPTSLKNNAEFGGWYSNAFFAGLPVAFPFEPSADTTLYAKWKQKYQVVFVTNGGSEVSATLSDIVDKSPETVKSGYVFAGWYKDKNLQEKITFPCALDCDCVFYAKWTEDANVPYKVEHYKQDVSLGAYVLSDAEIYSGTFNSLTNAAAKSYEGYVARNFLQAAILADASTVIKIYYDRIKLTVTFNANGGSGSMAGQEFYYGVPQALNANCFEKTGRCFIGWSATSEGDVVYKDSQVIVVKNNETLCAKWLCGSVISASDVPTLDLSALTEDYEIVVEGKISSSTLQALAEKIQGASMPITLDLSNATGVTELHGPASTNDSIFSNCQKLEKLVLPKTLKTIGAKAFQNCCFSSVVIPDSVTAIGSFAFYNCVNLNDINFGNGLEAIGENAFIHCDVLTSVVFPKSLATIQPTAFYSLQSLTSATFLDDKTWTVRNKDDYIASHGYTYKIAVNNPALNAARLKNDYSLYVWSKN